MLLKSQFCRVNMDTANAKDSQTTEAQATSPNCGPGNTDEAAGRDVVDDGNAPCTASHTAASQHEECACQNNDNVVQENVTLDILLAEVTRPLKRSDRTEDVVSIWNPRNSL